MDKLYPVDVDRAFRKLEQIKPDIATWWTSGGQSAQLISDGEVDMIQAWNGRITAVQAAGAPVAFDYNQGVLETNSKAIILELHQRFPDYVFAIISLANDAIEEDRLEDAKNLLWPLTSRTSWHGSEYLAYMSVQIRLCLAHGKIDSALSLLETVKKFQPADSRIQMLKLMIARAKLNSERGSML